MLWVAVAYLLGSVPFAQLVAMWRRGVDLREVGTGTVSGTGLYRVAGLRALVLGGLLDVLKGVAAVAPVADEPVLAVLAAAAVVVGHCWSVFLRGAGGRGISPALGALSVLAWPGALLLLVGLAIGRLVRQTGLGAFVADLALVAVLGVWSGTSGLALGVALVVPMFAKRLAGNQPPPPGAGARVYRSRLLFDTDPGDTTSAVGR